MLDSPVFGRSGGTQTRGLMNPNHPRYQLRYTPIVIKLWSCRWSNLWSNTVLTAFFHLPNRPKFTRLKGFRRLAPINVRNTVYAPKAGALPTALHPDFLFYFFLKIFRASLLCPPSCKIVAHGAAMQRPALCFAALPQAPCICHRQRSPSSPKAGALPTALHPDFLFCFFLKIFRASPALSARHTASTSRSQHLCYFNISGRVCQAGDWAGNCGAPSALMHTQRKTPPLWLTPGRWYSLGAKISPGTAGWTGSGHRYPAARLRWSCLRSPGAWPAARPPKRLHRS